MASPEDFSFPAVSDSHPATIDSPPLWRRPPNHSDSIRFDRRKSMSSIEIRGGAAEDKMDMLWEDLNDQLCFSTDDASSREMSLKLSRSKPGVVVIVKFLKKLLLLQRSPRRPSF